MDLRTRSIQLAVAFTTAVSVNGQTSNILTNPGFESGLGPWFATGPATLALTTDARTGQFAASLSNRQQFWNATNQNITGAVTNQGLYEFAAWVKTPALSPDPVVLTLAIDDALGLRFIRIVERRVPENQWTRIAGFEQISLVEPVNSVVFYVEGPPPGTDFIIDDASVTPIDDANWRDQANADIIRYRTRPLTVRIVDQDGLPRDDATISVQQTARHFRFGSALSAYRLDIPEYRDFFAQNFNMATPEASWKWPGIAPNPTTRDYAVQDEFRDFCVTNDIKIHGHNVLWAVDQFVPTWVQPLTGQPLRNAIDNHIADVVTRYADVTDAWDVNNEMLHGSFYETRLGPNFRADLFNQVRTLDPDVPLYMNDYNILTGSRVEDFLDQTQALLDQGAEINGLGVQGHYARPVSPFVLRAKLDRLASLNLPIRITEYDYTEPGATFEQRADSLEALYRVAFSHPSVEAVSLWGFWADQHWRGPEAALVELDWTINPVGQRLLDLFAEWQTNETAPADAQGALSLNAFHGDYDILAFAGDPQDNVVSTVSIEPGEGVVNVELVLPRTPCNPVDLAAPRGTLDANDLLAFIVTNPIADLDNDGVQTFFDVVEALRMFDAGCGG